MRGGTRQRLIGVIWVARGELDVFSVVNTNARMAHVVGALVDVCAQRTHTVNESSFASSVNIYLLSVKHWRPNSSLSGIGCPED